MKYCDYPRTGYKSQNYGLWNTTEGHGYNTVMFRNAHAIILI